RAPGHQLINHPCRHWCSLAAELYDVANARRIPDLSRSMRQTEIGKNIARENRADSLEDAIPLPKLCFGVREKGLVYDVLQILLRPPLCSWLCPNQIPVVHLRSYLTCAFCVAPSETASMMRC